MPIAQAISIYSFMSLFPDEKAVPCHPLKSKYGKMLQYVLTVNLRKRLLEKKEMGIDVRSVEKILALEITLYLQTQDYPCINGCMQCI